MTKVVLRGGGVTRVPLSQQTVAAIQENRPEVIVQASPTIVKAGGGMGVQGVPGAPGQSGGTIAPISFAWNEVTRPVFTAPTAGIFTIVRVDFTQAFDGAGAAIAVGTAADHAALMPAGLNDPGQTTSFAAVADLSVAEATQIVIDITPGTGASQGRGLLYLQFIPET